MELLFGKFRAELTITEVGGNEVKQGMAGQVTTKGVGSSVNDLAPTDSMPSGFRGERASETVAYRGDVTAPPPLPDSFRYKPERINVELFDKVMRKWTRDGVAPPISAQTFLAYCQEYQMDPTLALAMAALESNVGTAPGRPRITKNMFNVGNVDNGSNRYMKTWEQGFRSYLDLMTSSYGRRMEEIRPHFERKDGQGRYCPAPTYYKEIKSIVDSIRAELRPD